MKDRVEKVGSEPVFMSVFGVNGNWTGPAGYLDAGDPTKTRYPRVLRREADIHVDLVGDPQWSDGSQKFEFIEKPKTFIKSLT